MPHPPMFDDDDPVLGRLREITLTFPDAAEKVSFGMPAFFTTKVFAYYGGLEKVGSGHQRHHTSVLVLADPVDHEALLEDPRCYYPMYLGPAGWMGMRLDEDPDWVEVAELVETSYRLTAGARRVRELDARG